MERDERLVWRRGQLRAQQSEGTALNRPAATQHNQRAGWIR